MVKVRSGAGVKTSGKASRKYVPAPTRSQGRTSSHSSDRGHSSGNRVCPRETPEWQKQITNFFPAETSRKRKSSSNSNTTSKDEASHEDSSDDDDDDHGDTNHQVKKFKDDSNDNANHQVKKIKDEPNDEVGSNEDSDINISPTATDSDETIEVNSDSDHTIEVNSDSDQTIQVNSD